MAKRSSKIKKKDPKILLAIVVVIVALVFVVIRVGGRPRKLPVVGVNVVSQWVQAQGRAVAVAIGTDAFYITDSTAKQIDRYTRDGRVANKWGGLTNPNGIAVGSNGDVYINDNPNAELKRFNPSGRLVKIWKYNFYGQRGLAADSAGNLYVADTGNHKIVKIRSDGFLLKQWGKRGRGKDDLDEPMGICVDSQGSVYVSEQRNHRVHKYTAEGQTLKTWSLEPGLDKGYPNAPYIAVDNTGHVYITDEHSSRIQIFTDNGELVGVTPVGFFSAPVGIAADPSDGTIIVLDKGYRVQRVSFIFPAKGTK